MFLMMSHYAAWATPLEESLLFSGFLGAPDVYEKLAPGPKDGVKLRWINPNADLTKYNKFMVDSVYSILPTMRITRASIPKG